MRACAAVQAAALLLSYASEAGAQQRFGAIEALPTLEPRWYPPAVVDPIVKRQDVPNCGQGSHSCLDIEAPQACCDNSRYCFINKQGQPKCCMIGEKCDSQCEPEFYQCNRSTTVTSTITGSLLVETKPAQSCCSRGCPSTSSFRCPTQLGHGCCQYGATCASGPGGSSCLVAQTPTPTGLVPQAPSGCTTSQITCAGGGCCDVGKACTRVSDKAYCASVPVTPTDAGVAAVPQDQGLSAGAKAGIAVGVVLAAAVIIGIATWLCIRKRRYGTVSFRSRSVSQIQGSGYGGPRSRASIPVMVGGGGGGGDPSDRGGPVSGSASEVRYPTADYFGPDAVVGPYTDLDSPTTMRDNTTPGFERGVPVEPDGPSHIVAPVELDSGRSQSGKSGYSSPSRASNIDARALSLAMPTPPAPETAEDRYELYGSDTAAPAHEPENPEAEHAAQQPDVSHVLPPDEHGP